jgi:hypothetical protein
MPRSSSTTNTTFRCGTILVPWLGQLALMAIWRDGNIAEKAQSQKIAGSADQTPPTSRLPSLSGTIRIICDPVRQVRATGSGAGKSLPDSLRGIRRPQAGPCGVQKAGCALRSDRAPQECFQHEGQRRILRARDFCYGSKADLGLRRRNVCSCFRSGH